LLVLVNILRDEALNNDTHQYIGAFVCILYRYEECLFQEMCTLNIDIKTNIHRLYCIKR